MSDPTILAMAGDDGWLARMHSGLRALSGVRLIVTQSMAETSELLDSATVNLIVVNWAAPLVSYEQMDELLWVNSTLHHPAPVLVTSETYEAGQAVTLFQMGVNEYIGLAEQRDKLPLILCQLLMNSPVMEHWEAVPWRQATGQRLQPLHSRLVRSATPA
jgi:hypothetical protein